MADFWESAKSVLATVAPTLATALGGPLAGVAVRGLIGALGLTPDSTEQQVASAITSATPEQLLALKQADQQFAEKMKELDISLVKMRYDDVEGAREREEKVKDRTPALMGGFLIVAFVATTAAVLLGYAHVDSALAGTLIGYLSAKAEQVLAYYFGNSVGSSNKDELLYNSVPAPHAANSKG